MIPHRKATRWLAAALPLLMLTALPGEGAEPPPQPAPVLEAKFAPGTAEIPAGWRHAKFPSVDRATQYRAVDEDGRGVLRAEADRSASMLIWETPFDPSAYPWVEWDWRITGPVPGADLRSKATDDAAARVMVLFDAPPAELAAEESWGRRLFRHLYREELPTRGLAYLASLAQGAPGDRWMFSAYTRHMRLLPLLLPETGGAPAGTPSASGLGPWQHYRRNIPADFAAAFGEPLPSRAHLAILVDTDDTGQHTVSELAGVRLLPR